MFHGNLNNVDFYEMSDGEKCSGSFDGMKTLFGDNGDDTKDDSGKVFYKTATDIKDQKQYCMCGGNGNSDPDPYLKVWLSNSVSGIKTIIFVGYEKSYSTDF